MAARCGKQRPVRVPPDHPAYELVRSCDARLGVIRTHGMPAQAIDHAMIASDHSQPVAFSAPFEVDRASCHSHGRLANAQHIDGPENLLSCVDGGIHPAAVVQLVQPTN